MCNLDDPQRTARVSGGANKWEASEVEWNPHFSHRTLIASAVCPLVISKILLAAGVNPQFTIA
jgi:hypothetical protein